MYIDINLPNCSHCGKPQPPPPASSTKPLQLEERHRRPPPPPPKKSNGSPVVGPKVPNNGSGSPAVKKLPPPPPPPRRPADRGLHDSGVQDLGSGSLSQVPDISTLHLTLHEVGALEDSDEVFLAVLFFFVI